jgi:hypothetical protein
VSFGLLHSVRVEAKGGQSSKVRDLEEQRLATLRNLVKITSERFKSGQASFDELRSATSAQEDAELDLCSSAQERIAVLERAVAEAKVCEDQQAKLAANKLLPETSLLKTTADRLQQEILLEQALAK